MTILSLGFILLAGLLAGKLIRQIKIPMVTAYLLLGVIIGPTSLNLVTKEGILTSSGLISNIVLALIAFSIGQNFALERFRKIGRPVIWISILAAIAPWFLVTAGIFILLHQPFFIALLFGAISSATAPAATMMVVREYKAKGSFTDTLLGIVAIDDAWCLIIFALSFAIAKAFAVQISSNYVIFRVLFNSLLEIVGAFILGGLLALILSYLSRFVTTPSDLLIYTLGFIFLNTGLALYLNFSVLLANMFMAAVLVNVHKVSFKFFATLRTIDSPLYLLFFVLAGANLEIGLLKTLGLLGLVYIIFRSLGKIGGAYLGGLIAQVPARMKNYMGWALLPQAGVALGVALIAKAEFPALGGMIFSTIVATTVIYEIVGPIFTKISLKKAGEI